MGIDPSWSPDGTRIAFSRLAPGMSNEINVMNADGSNVQRLTSDYGRDVDPAWSPDGTKIVWTKDARPFVMNADGSGQTPLSTGIFFGILWTGSR